MRVLLLIIARQLWANNSSITGLLDMSSRLQELALDLGNEVERFTSKIEEEKRKILESKSRFEAQIKVRKEHEAETAALCAEIEHIKSNNFNKIEEIDSILQKENLKILTKIVGEIRASGHKIREERIEVLTQYKEKLDKFEAITQKNRLLESFFETWKENLANGKDIAELPAPIRDISQAIANYYEIPPHEIAEEIFKTRKLEEGHSQKKQTAFTCGDTVGNDSDMVLDSTVVHHPKSLSSGDLNNTSITMNFATKDFSYLGNLIDLDSTLTGGNSNVLFSEEGLHKLLHSCQDQTMQQENAP